MEDNKTELTEVDILNEIDNHKIISKIKKASYVTKNMVNKVFKKYNTKMYTIIIDDGNIIINDESDNLMHHDTYNTLTYERKKDCIMMSNILISLIYKYKNIYTGEFYTNDIDGNSVLYVFLLPILSKDNKYIIKVGYTTKLQQRYTQLKKEHGVDEIYLIYVEHIKNESIEKKLHTILKKTNNILYYPTEKYKKSENPSFCTETYIFNYLTYLTIIKEIYRMNQFDMMNMKIKLVKEETKLKETEVKRIECETKLKEIEFEKIKEDNRDKDKERDFELTKLQYMIRLKELEKLH